MITDMLKMKLMMGLGNSIIAEICVLLSVMFFSSYQQTFINYCQLLLQRIVPTKHMVTIKGKQVLHVATWSCTNKNIFGVHMNAFWEYLKQHKFDDIYQVDELESTYFDNMENEPSVSKQKNNFLFVANQLTPFRVNKHIYCKITNKQCENISSNNKNDSTIQMQKICIELYSYSKPVDYIVDFIEIITKQYTDNIENKSKGKLYIYNLLNTNVDSKNWHITEFKSTKCFDNLYFDGKQELITKIEHFENGIDWYEKEGIPYTLGIGLYGAPGTGKTSIIKCIANKMRRHIITISLNKINTEEEFFNIFFETRYNNELKCVDFKDKIIVFEDIDCMSDIVQNRDENPEDINTHFTNLIDSTTNLPESSTTFLKNYLKAHGARKISLSFVLNLIDGLHETYGRVLIITSNYFNKLDSAIKRPGRIDIILEMKNVTKHTLNEMCNHFYGRQIPEKNIEVFKDYHLSPAEIINIHITSKNYSDFIQNITNKMKIT